MTKLGVIIECAICSKPITGEKLGIISNVVVTKRGSSILQKKIKRYYHKECYENINMR